MKPNYDCYPYMGEPEQSFDQKMKAGKDLKGGIAESMPMRDAHDRPWTTEVHKPTRSGKNENI